MSGNVPRTPENVSATPTPASTRSNWVDESSAVCTIRGTKRPRIPSRCSRFERVAPLPPGNTTHGSIRQFGRIDDLRTGHPVIVRQCDEQLFACHHARINVVGQEVPSAHDHVQRAGAQTLHAGIR